ncbi:MAG: pyridoxamine 5'-phosphate oxidase [Bacteroidota bacterium]
MTQEELQQLRQDYAKHALDESDVNADPFEQLKVWIEEALTAKVPEPNAFSLATVDKDGKPHNRVVLLKGMDERGIHFFTNYASDKGQEIDDNPNVSVCFLWLELERQVRIDGVASKLTEEENNEYFQVRPYKSQIGALASNQSEIVENRSILEDRFADLERQYVEGEVPKPSTWGGYSIKPSSFEFWQGRRSRLHDRIKFEQENNQWIIKRLSP